MPTNINGNTGIDKVQDGTVVNADIDTLDASKLTGSIAAARIANNTIDSAHIASGAVDDAHLATGITASKLTGALPAISAASLTNVPKDVTVGGRKNILINGGFEIAQRGTTISGIGSAKYTLDRWNAISSGADSTVTQVSGATYPKALRLTGAGSTSGTYLQQKIESKNSRHLAGQTATFSVYLRASTAINIEFSIKYATSDDNFGGTTSIASTTFNVTTTDTKFTWTGSIPSAATTGIQVELKISSQGSAWYEASNAQLELGSVATDFEYRSYGEELALCQRYYEVLGSTAVADYGFMYIGGNWTTANSRFTLQWAVTKRASPTITESGTWYVRNSSGSSIAVTAKTFDQPSPYGAAPYVNCSGGLTVGHTAQIWGDDGLIKVDAEF